jgi:nucleotide-binding universal stress UspA family protein
MKKLLLATDLSPRILQEVVSNRADLLVLGTRGRTGVAHASSAASPKSCWRRRRPTL